MSVAKNSMANYAGQIYSILIGIVVTPLYMQYLGAEAYGLVGFFALMQAWMGLLDMGLSPTLGRQVAYARGQKNGFVFFRKLLKSFELIFFVISVTIAIGVYIASDFIVIEWLNTESLEFFDVYYCIVLMGLMIGLRWFASLYRSGIKGMERQVVLNAFNVSIITFKFAGALLLLAFVSNDVRHFFEFQLVVAVVELFVLGMMFYRFLPETTAKLKLVNFDFCAVKSVAPFALSISYTSAIWILLTQTDKFVLSGILTLTEFGYFSLVALAAGAINKLSGPILQALMPRMTVLLSEGDVQGMLKIYRQSSQIVALICFSVALMIGLYAEILIFAWTGNYEAARWGSDVLMWFALGNGILAIGAFQYYLQSAFGNLRLHVIGSTISALIQVPLIYYAAVNYGALGVAWLWFAFRLFWFLWWTPIIHNRFIPGFHLSWLFKDLLPVVLSVTTTALLLNNFIPLEFSTERYLLIVQMILIGCLVLLLSSFTVKPVRQYFNVKFS